MQPLDRRELLLTFLAGGSALAGPKYAPKLAAQAYVWQQALGREKRSIADGVADVVASLAEAGYRTVELTDAFFATPELAARTRELLDKHRLRLAMVYHGGDMHETEAAARTIDETLALVERVPRTVEAVSFNANPKKGADKRKTDGELATQVRALEDLRRQLRTKKLLLHQHAPELAGNAREWRWMLHHTNVGFCLDVHWVQRAGLDPMTLLAEAGTRLGALHLRNSQNGIWTEDLETGSDVDYGKVAAYLRKHGYTGWLVVELATETGTQVTHNITESLRRSRVWTERTFQLAGRP